jgi:hypothetical protein
MYCKSWANRELGKVGIFCWHIRLPYVYRDGKCGITILDFKIERGQSGKELFIDGLVYWFVWGNGAIL